MEAKEEFEFKVTVTRNYFKQDTFTITGVVSQQEAEQKALDWFNDKNDQLPLQGGEDEITTTGNGTEREKQLNYIRFVVRGFGEVDKKATTHPFLQNEKSVAPDKYEDITTQVILNKSYKPLVKRVYKEGVLTDDETFIYWENLSGADIRSILVVMDLVEDIELQKQDK